MSAIAGAVLTDGRDVSGGMLAAMVEAAVPRGFDGVSRWYNGPAGLIRFHHATTPEAVGEVQPLPGPSGAVILFDGRLDNRDDLIALLGPRGHDLVTAPDAAIALTLFETRGEAFLDTLVGDWALAIWQPGPRRLFCARSPMGWRPFLWRFDGKTFGFSTEPRTLIVGLGIDRRFNEGAIAEMITTRFATHTETLWHGIQRLEQGGALALEGTRVRTWHWHNGPFEDHRGRSEADMVERFAELLDAALKSAIRSSTPAVAHLSGGLDSSTIVARLTELHRAGLVDRQIIPISARFPGEAQDETQWSSAVEAHLKLPSRVTAADPYSFDAARSWCKESLQLPLRPNVNDTTTATFRVMQANGERVLLTGSGGDDWIAGTLAHLPDMLLRGDLFGLFREAMDQFPREPGWKRLRRGGFLALAPIASRSYREQFIHPHLAIGAPLPEWIRGEWAASIGFEERARAGAPPVDPPGFAAKQRYSVFANARRYLAHEPIIAFAERHGVEMRHPFHDLRLASFFMNIPGRMLMRGGERKHILREATRGTLPELVRTRQDKAIFITSLVDAIAERLRERPPETMLPVRMGWIDGARFVEAFGPAREWRETRSTAPSPRAKLGAIWFAIAADLWLEQAVGL